MKVLNIHEVRSISGMFLLSLFFLSCSHQNGIPEDVSNDTEIPHYISVDGIWKCTPETSLKFPNGGSLEPVIIISGAFEQNLSVRGCFLWEERFHTDWKLVSIHFNDSTNQLNFIDEDGDEFIGQVDQENRSINGYVYSGDPDNSVPMDKLDFERADEKLANRLFYPRLPQQDESIIYNYQAPEHYDDGMPTASLFEHTKDSTAFYQLMAGIIQQEYGRLESLLIMKDHNLIVEEYYYGYDHTELHNIHSCTKSIASLILGIVLEDHPEIKMTTPVLDLFPQYDSLITSGKELITLNHLLTMTAGLDEDDVPGIPVSDDQLLNILRPPLKSQPGDGFQYNNNNSILLGGIIFELEGKHADVIAKETLFGPLGITKYSWEMVNGLPQCHSDLHLLPRDMVKIGQLVLNDGKWNNEQVVPEAWIIESTKPHVPESEFY